MVDIFSTLRAGIRFNRMKFGAEIACFEPTSATTSTNSVAQLDFFADPADSAAASPASAVLKTRKRRKGPDGPRGAGAGTGDNDPNDHNDHVAAEYVATVSTDGSAGALRRQYRIHAKGADLPDPLTSFDGLAATTGLHASIARHVASMYTTPTPIQMQAVPVMLARRDLFGVAPTGSGKTMAYVLPIFAHLRKPMAKGFRACILAPTRELAQQIKRACDLLCEGTKFQVRLLDKSTASKNSFGAESSHKFDVLIATPLRLVKCLAAEAVDLQHVEWLVLDEADRLFDNGFEEQVDGIVAACSLPTRRIALFSATMPPRVEELARTVLQDPIRVTVGAHNSATSDIDQQLMFVGKEDGKLVAIHRLVQEGAIKPPVLIFVQSKTRAQELFHELVYDGLNVDVIHADRTRQQRDAIVQAFRAGKIWVLITTDLMGRGLDFKGINLVINFDFPPNAVEYIHRIGRTGRAGRRGKAITFFTIHDAGSLKPIVNVMRASGCDVPDWMLELKSKKNGRTRTIERASVSTALEPHRALKTNRKRKRTGTASSGGDDDDDDDEDGNDAD